MNMIKSEKQIILIGNLFRLASSVKKLIFLTKIPIKFETYSVFVRIHSVKQSVIYITNKFFNGCTSKNQYLKLIKCQFKVTFIFRNFLNDVTFKNNYFVIIVCFQNIIRLSFFLLFYSLCNSKQIIRINFVNS